MRFLYNWFSIPLYIYIFIFSFFVFFYFYIARFLYIYILFLFFLFINKKQKKRIYIKKCEKNKENIYIYIKNRVYKKLHYKKRERDSTQKRKCLGPYSPVPKTRRKDA